MTAHASDTLRCAVIGLGMGRNHARRYHEDPDATLVAVADLDESRLADWEPTVGEGHTYTDYKQMLREEKPDIVSIGLPNFLHKPVTLDCLEAGAHVLCEKPMAMNVAEAREMKAAAEAAGKTLGIHLSTRFGAKQRAMKDLADAGAIGEAYHAYTHWTRRDGMPGFGGWFGQKDLSGGGPLIDLGVHRIDLAMWLMGEPTPVTVSGQTHSQIGVKRAKEQGKKYDVEDFAAGFVRFSNGASLVFEASWAGMQEHKESLYTRVMGSKGALVTTTAPPDWNNVPATFIHRVNGMLLESAIDVPGDRYKNSVSEFVAAIKEGRPYLATPDDGIRIQQVLDGLYASAREGKEINVEL